MNYRNRTIYTIGHSNRDLDELTNILVHYGVCNLADVRHYPGSSRNPQFKRKVLEKEFPAKGIEYIWIKDLGGFREGGYRKYTATDQFKNGFEKLIIAAESKVTAIMCAEIDWHRCHRRFIADILYRSGWNVVHIYNENKAETYLPDDSERQCLLL